MYPVKYLSPFTALVITEYCCTFVYQDTKHSVMVQYSTIPDAALYTPSSLPMTIKQHHQDKSRIITITSR